MAKPTAWRQPEQVGEDEKDDDADNGDRRVLAREIGRGAFLDRRRDFLHARGARVGGEHGARGDHAVNDGENAASNDQVKHYGHNGIVPVRLVEIGRKWGERARHQQGPAA